MLIRLTDPEIVLSVQWYEQSVQWYEQSVQWYEQSVQ
jgi:hypothetical protein